MCLAIPMQIVEIDGFMARCHAKGIERDISLFMLQDETLAPDDYVMVHVGYAIQKVSEQEARSAWQLYDEVLAMEMTTSTAAACSSAAMDSICCSISWHTANSCIGFAHFHRKHFIVELPGGSCYALRSSV